MNEKLDKKLVEKYPKIFADRHADMKTTAMCWGFEHGDGWYWLIDKMCESIQGYMDSNPHLNIHQVVAVQVKEKFAGLRFYYQGGDDRIEGIVQFAEHLSYYICEYCGSTEDIGCTQGWFSTCCEKCYNASEHLSKREWKRLVPKKGQLRDSNGRFTKKQ